MKGKREMETYAHLNAEFQGIARKDKKALLSDQCKEIEENNRMRKTRDFFKKIRDTKGTFHAKMGTIKDRNCIDLTESEDIKRWCKKNQLHSLTLFKNYLPLGGADEVLCFQGETNSQQSGVTPEEVSQCGRLFFSQKKHVNLISRLSSCLKSHSGSLPIS